MPLGCVPAHGHVPTSNAEYWPRKLARNRKRHVLVSLALQNAGWEVIRVREHAPPDQAVEGLIALVDFRDVSREEGSARSRDQSLALWDRPNAIGVRTVSRGVVVDG
jgi:G:T-mismatch repair DNA endonuclease (very short patch repair protein)